MHLSALSKVLIMAGGILVIAGLVVALCGRIPGIGRLPGDVLIKRGDVTIYVPITTCILVSIALTLIGKLLTRH